MGTRDASAHGLHAVLITCATDFFSSRLLFLLRVVLRNQWLAAAAFVLLLTLPLALQGDICGWVCGRADHLRTCRHSGTALWFARFDDGLSVCRD